MRGALARGFTLFAAGVAAMLVAALPAGAQTPYPPVVQPTVVTQGGGGGAPAAEAGGGLAFTGAEIGLLVLAAAVLATIGALALTAARRRAAHTA